MVTEDEGRPGGAVPVLGVPDDSHVTAVPYAALPGQLKAELAGQVARLGYLGGFFSLAAHQPGPLLHFNRFTEALKDALPGRLSNVVALAVAAAANNQYELVQHIRLARSQGIPDAWIRAAASREAGAGGGLLPEEQEVLALVQAAMAGVPASAHLREVVACLGEPAAIAVLLLLGRYVAHAMVSRVLQLGPPVPLDPPLDLTPARATRRTP